MQIPIYFKLVIATGVVFQILAAPPAAAKLPSSCLAALSNLPTSAQVKHALRSVRLLPPGMSLPSVVQHRISERFDLAEQEAWHQTLTHRQPITYFEALDAEGFPLVRESDWLEETNDLEGRLQGFLEALTHFDRTRGEIAKIRMVYTHPPRFLSSYHDAAALDLLLGLHALMEAKGGNEIEMELSLIAAESGPSHALDAFFGDRRVPIIKKSIRISPHSLSYAAGDYWLEKSMVAELEDLKALVRESGVEKQY